MTSFLYNIAKKGMQDGSVNLDTDTLKVALIAGTAAGNPDDDTVATVLGTSAELSTTGYTAGASSSDRQTVAVAVTVDDSNNRSDAVTAAATFPSVAAGSSPNDAVDKYLLYKHTGTNDANNIPIALVDDATGLPLALNGSDVEVAALTIRLT